MFDPHGVVVATNSTVGKRDGRTCAVGAVNDFRTEKKKNK